ncbi:hypothetical protein CHLNCDRAFT_25287 [Chlorella variabilis]|uniref:Mitochondrial folate transporter/carrier n=1 Tax=Chlorella variabilis TaxID=554065 RepID=E1ZJC8_CHLVA|nr:hypothetical protein CHLNCDRAFT_25287 [Chlorella variabilis]EFN53971.1 hypothetical protein CHLNCDRAFT_25287 [Chlorella variabilis]|eukprot:XP_005846073.1 hypothetical protein CHLNCDRAFT_25287 [Chlorella variabilis]
MRRRRHCGGPASCHRCRRHRCRRHRCRRHACRATPGTTLGCPSPAPAPSQPPTLAALCRRHALAGATAGLCTQLALHPLDVVKTRLQVQDGAGLLPAYRGTVDALRQIVRQEGWKALYSGLTPALAGSGMAWGIYFFAYNRAKQRYQRAAGQARLSPGKHLISAAEAGVLVCFLTNPVWVVKTRLQLQRRTACAVEYRGFLHAFVQIARCEGLPGLYKGLLPSLLLVSHGAIQFAVYEELKSAAQGFAGGGAGQQKPARQLSPPEITACGALSKLAASVTTYPSQARRGGAPARLTPAGSRRGHAREGPGGFYKGLVPNVVRVMPQSAITFLVYESVMRLLERQPQPQ